MLIINMVVMLGGIILQPAIGMILDYYAVMTLYAYQVALIVLPVGLFIAAGLSCILKESYPRHNIA